MPSRNAPARTLWEEGRHPGRLVVRAATLALLVVVLVSLLLGNRIGLVFDLAFVVVCVAAALAVRPRDFFTVGVMPPLLLAATVAVLAFVDPAAVARAGDAVAQAVVSGLAHHAIALVIGYALTLGILALRQVALRHHGRLRISGEQSSGRAAAPATPRPDRTMPVVQVPGQRRAEGDLSSATAADRDRRR
ncbi:MAG TPA: DUF6542 domain-containing protein [Marmoricola sp.]|nr:DUF6542 domain-containing protein [Marmoricola sp.]